MSTKRLVIIDGYSLLYRAFYGTKFLSTSDGRPTNALFGLVNMLFHIIERQKPEAILVALDAPGKTFRHAEYAEYKGTRREMPEEMKVQMPVARELLAALGIPQLELTGYEADDIIGTISLQAEKNGYATTIVSGDLDGLQLVDSMVSYVTPKVGVTEVAFYDTAAVRDRFGLEPTQLPDYKALAGDSSDNIKGVPGVGDKTASMLVARFGSVEQMIERLNELEEKFRKKIEPCVNTIPTDKWLATINREVPVEYDFAPFKLNGDGAIKGKQMLESLEFRNHLRRFDLVFGPYMEGFVAGAAPVEIKTEVIEVNRIATPRSFDLVEKWVGDAVIGLIPSEDQAQQSMFDEGEAAQWCVAKGKEAIKIPAEWALMLLEQKYDQCILHDAKSVYRKHANLLVKPRFDTMLGGYVLQSGRAAYALRDLAQGYLELAPPESVEQKAVSLGYLEKEMRTRLEKDGQLPVLTDMEQPLIPILAAMERTGIEVSADFLGEFSKSLQVEIEKSTKLIHEMAGQEFLIASPKQLGEVLFEKMGIPGARKTKTGYATGAEVLQILAPTYPIAAEVMTWRELTKLKSTYSDSLPRMIEADHRIHTTYNQTVAATGRLSSADPNLQNIPIRTELGRQIRRAFTAAEGFTLLSFDYSQIELRVLAHMCADNSLVEAFQTGMDVHTATAATMYGIEPADVTKQQRGLAKMLNYAVLYGVTDFGLANQLQGEFSIAEAKELIKQYNERFPKIKAFTEGLVDEARKKGFTTTLNGRRRYFPDIHAANRNERMYAERQAMNAPIQGTAADMMKLAMIDVWPLMQGRKSRLLLQVHDELLFELHPDERDLVEPIRNAIEDALPLSVPVEVDAKEGANWDEMKPIARITK